MTAENSTTGNPTKARSPTPSEERILKSLLRVWSQYNSWGSEDRRLSHACMTAGEDATDLLEEYGLAIDDGWHAVLTEAGIRLLESDE